MAKKSGTSKALGYQESFFANRNDMLQSALDAVLLKIDNEQARYEAEVELYKEASKMISREKERLKKTIDDLKKGQIDKDLAVSQWNAGQQNSTARTSASIEAANARFNAKQAALAAYYGTRGFSAGRDPSNSVTLGETQQAYNANPGNVGAGFSAYYKQTQVTTGVPKTSDDIDKGSALLFNSYVASESRDPKYDFFDDASDRVNAARDVVLEKLPPADKAAVERGLVKLNPQAAAGAGLQIDEAGEVNVGGIDVKTVGKVDYSGLIKDAEARLGRMKDAEAKTPVAPKEPDLIDLQRKEYFDKFYSGYVPRYEMNEIMQKLIDLPDSEAQAFANLYKSRYSPVAGMENVPGARRIRDLPTTPGGVIGGEGSPFVPTDRFSDKGKEILGNIPSNQFYIEDMENPTEAGLQERANLLAAEGFGLQKTIREDGRILYTVVPFDQLGLYGADQVIMPEKTIPFYRGTPDTRINPRNVAKGEPFNPAKYDEDISALTSELDRLGTNILFIKDTATDPSPELDELKKLQFAYDQVDLKLNDLLMRRGNMQSKVDEAGVEPRRLQPITGDRAEVRRIDPKPGGPVTRKVIPNTEPIKEDLEPIKENPEPKENPVTPFELSKKDFVLDPTDYDYRYKSDGKGGFEVEFKGKKVKPAPVGSDAAKAIEGVLTAPEIEVEAPTAEQTDARIKFDAAKRVQSIYGTPEFNKLLNTELGKAVSDLYSVNKAKGDESGGEVLSYIATEFPRAEDQSKAAQILMGLSYGDKNKGLLKA